MKQEMKKELRFYITLLLGFILLVIGCFIPPAGVISSSILIGAGMILTLTAGIIGIDLSKVIKEFRYLQEGVMLSEEEKKEIKDKFLNDLKD